VRAQCGFWNFQKMFDSCKLLILLVSPSGFEPETYCLKVRPSISANGRFVAFLSASTNLIPGGGPDTNGNATDIFVFDRLTGSLELISRQDIADGGAQANLSSGSLSISADGRFVAFLSASTNLIPGGGPERPQPDVGGKNQGRKRLISRWRGSMVVPRQFSANRNFS